MYLANVMKPGDFLTPVPVGLPMTIQYNFSGNLEKVYLRFGNDRVDVSGELLETIRKNHTVPAIVHVKKGITLIRGVLYTAELLYDTGHLPYCVEDSLKAKFLKNPSQFNFFAATWDSSEAIVQGSASIRQMLTMSKFKILPGWLVPTGMNRDMLRRFVTYPSYTFNPEMLTNYIIFRGEQIVYHTTQMKQFVVSKIVKYTDENGFIKVRLYTIKSIDEQFGNHISVDYSDLLKYDIQIDSLVVLDAINQIIYTKPTTDKRHKKVSSQLICSYCNKSFTSPKEGQVICPDEHCVSRLIPQIKQFMTVVGLDVPEVDVISKWITDNLVRSIPDIFNLSEYTVGEVELKLTLAQILRSMIPFTVIPKVDVMKIFANNCTNNVDMFLHYCEHPSSAISDLNMNHKDFSRLSDWLEDNYNLSDIQTLLSIPQIVIEKQDKKFDGAPIFRNKTIYLTGDFIHGPISDIVSILSSYSAKVILNFDDVVDCVLVGGLHENINGEAVQRARSLGISIFEEEDFFMKYEIDEDMKTNLQ